MIIYSLFSTVEQFILPLSILLICVLVHTLQSSKLSNVIKIRNILYAHGIASLLALITSLLNIYYTDSIIVPLVMFISLIIITNVQTERGYIENMEGASGVLLYLSSVLTPAVIILVAFLMILYYYKFYFPDDDRSCQIIIQILNIGEALLLTIINIIVPTTTIAGCFWTVICCFIVFSLLLPDLNLKAAPIILAHLPNTMVSALNKGWV